LWPILTKANLQRAYKCRSIKAYIPQTSCWNKEQHRLPGEWLQKGELSLYQGGVERDVRSEHIFDRIEHPPLQGSDQSQALVTHAYNPTYSEVRDQEDLGSNSAQTNSLQDSISK
jgi:hypothetical protein